MEEVGNADAAQSKSDDHIKANQNEMIVDPAMDDFHVRINYHLVLIGLDVVVGLALCGIGVAYFIHFRKKKEQ